MSTHNLCFEQNCEKYQNFLSDFFSFFGGKIFIIYLNRLVFVMTKQMEFGLSKCIETYFAKKRHVFERIYLNLMVS